MSIIRATIRVNGYSHGFTDEQRVEAHNWLVRALNDEVRNEDGEPYFLTVISTIAKPLEARPAYGFDSADVMMLQDRYFEFLEQRFYDLELTARIKDRTALDAFNQSANKQQTPQTGLQNEYNNRVEVHIAGHALSTYNRVLLLEDCCTDNLQAHLSLGWRIIASNPQPDQRRNDFVLGKFEPGFTGADEGLNYVQDSALRRDPNV